MADMAEFVKGLEAFFVTRFMTKKLTPNAATILFIKPAREILDESKPKPTVKELLKRLNTDEKTTMTEDEVVDLLMVRDYGSGNARRNLKAIFVYLANTKVKPDAPIPMDMGVSDYEHILPGRPKKNSAWVQTLFPDEEQRKHDTHMLGNAALWYNKDNRGVQNAEFEVKKTYYADSSIPDTRDLAKLSTWDHDQVVKRTRKLAQEIADYFYQEY